jgi:hypothetical protein
MGTTMKRSDDFISVPYPKATSAVLMARSHGIMLSAIGSENINMAKKDSRIDEGAVSDVRKVVSENKLDILKIFEDQETYQTPLAQMRGQLVEFNMQIASLIEELRAGILAYDWLFPESGCFTGEEGGCNEPPMHPRCHACRKDDSYENKKDKAV